MHRGIATFTLDYGRCPPWLFQRMVALSLEMVRVIIKEEGSDEFVKRMADPAWFQSLGTVLAFDWNASGLTTILTAALKEAIRGEEKELGIFICGGKGKTSKKTPSEIEDWGEKLALPGNQTDTLIYNSRMTAKVDSALIQDGYQIYHHSFIFSRNGAWTVVQQGMNTSNVTARRYHWHSDQIADLRGQDADQRGNLINEPHTGIVSEIKLPEVLNLTAEESGENRELSSELVKDQTFPALMKDIKLLSKHSSSLSSLAKFKIGNGQLSLLHLEDTEFDDHPVVYENFAESKYLQRILWKLCDEKPENYEKMLATAGVGPKTIRALALVSEVIYGAKPSYEDPARYSFAHGGKDATPYPVDRPTYDETIEKLRQYAARIKTAD